MQPRCTAKRVDRVRALLPVLCFALLAGCGRIGFEPLRADAGSMDGGSADRDTGMRVDSGPECVPVAELCNSLDDDCDGMVDEDFDRSTDLAHCGACGVACPVDPPNGLPRCSGGLCGVACDPGFVDCDERSDNGCEANLLDPATCGGCATACADGTPLCEDLGGGPECVVACGAATTRCGESCVDLSTNPLHCGRCRAECPVPPNSAAVCGEGTCAFECDPGFDDCDGLPDNGCEASLSSPGHCGVCDVVCALAFAVSGCVDARCVVAACVGDHLDCDGMDENGCEAAGVVAYPDRDLDGEGAAAVPALRVCELAAGLSGTNGDCNDDDPRAFPGQTEFFATAAVGGGFDFDCVGGELQRWRDAMLCISGPMCMITRPGWEIVPPPCGGVGNWVTDCTGSMPCTIDSALRTQECR